MGSGLAGSDLEIVIDVGVGAHVADCGLTDVCSGGSDALAADSFAVAAVGSCSDTTADALGGTGAADGGGGKLVGTSEEGAATEGAIEAAVDTGTVGECSAWLRVLGETGDADF